MELPLENRNFFQTIKVTFGEQTAKDLKLYLNDNIKLAKLINQQHFLLRCRKEKIFSKTRRLKNSCNINNEVFLKLQNQFIFGIMNQEISETVRDIKTVKHNLNLLQHFLETVLPSDVLNEFVDRVNTTYNYHFNTIKVRQKNKFQNIVLDSLNGLTDDLLNTSDNWIMNISNIDLPLHVKFVLSLGHKFCPPSIGNAIPYFQIISDVECAIFSLNDDYRTTFRNNFVNILTNFKHTSNSNSNVLNPIERRILSFIKQTKAFLKEHPNLHITRADKGNITVVTTHDNYMEKMYSLLEDRSTYIPSRKDNTNKLQTAANLFFKKWEESGIIDTQTKKKLTRYNSVIPKLYGLPKIHKINIPYRPIVSCIGSPTYQLSSFLSEILSHSVGKSKTSIVNSEDFKQKIKDVILPLGYVLVSFDVVSLFTNVDNSDVVKLIHNNYRNIKKNSGTKLNKIQFLEALDLVLNNTEFAFDSKHFKQFFGVPMGSPISPIVANLKMEDLETRVLNSLNFQPIFYYRYVDDIITAVPDDKVTEFLNILNLSDNRIKFTVERESNNKLPFLDLTLIHEPNGRISFDWFHKDTWSGRYLNFHSWLPLKYKINTIKILTHKILKLSDTKFHYRNFLNLTDTLLNNHYPLKLIENTFRKQIFSSNFTTRQSLVPNYNVNYFSIPYVKVLYEKIKHLFRNSGLKIVARSATNLNNLFFSKVKDVVPLKKQSNVVYQVQCNDCPATYTGQTKQLLEKRIYQHNYGMRSNSTNQTASALTQHLKDTKHKFSLENVKILDKESNYKKRSILEMLHIKSSENSLNIQSDCAYIGDTYNLFT